MYVSKFRTLELTDKEAVEHLHVIFVPDSPASDYYHKYVENCSATLEDCFKKLYDRFMSNERRDRLVREWNSLDITNYLKKSNATPQSALADLCQNAQSLQMQLGEEYQPDILLRDAIMRAVKSQPFSRFLPLARAQTALELQEACSRAIEAQESQTKEDDSYTRAPSASIGSSSSDVPAFGSELLYSDSRNNLPTRTYSSQRQSGQRQGLPGRRYGQPNRQVKYQAPVGNRRLNPMKNGLRMKCRGCGSEWHFIRNCNKVAPASIAFYATALINSDQDLESFDQVLDQLQNVSDSEWNNLLEEHDVYFESSEDKERNDLKPTSAEICYNTLADQATEHYFLRDKDIRGPKGIFSKWNVDNSRCNQPFEGICMDNGAQKSVSGINAYLRYCKHAHVTPSLVPSKDHFKFGVDGYASLGTADIRMPIDEQGNFLEFPINVTNADVPMLFGLDLMKELGWYTNEVENTFCKDEPYPLTVPLVFKKGHLYLEWPDYVILFTKMELEKLHRRFAHPSAEKLTNLLQRADPLRCEPGTRKVLEEIAKACKACQIMSPKPYVFQVAMPDNIQFNHEVQLDLMFIDKKAILHVVDRGTHFSAARFIRRQNVEAVWNALIECWIAVYVGFPNIFAYDQGSVFNSELFTQACKQFGIIMKPTPTESHNSLSSCERYHAPLRRIYKKLQIEFPRLNEDTRLSLAVQALNNTAGPDGLVPTLLVFGMVPKLPLGHIENYPKSQRDRFAALEAARREMETIVAEQRLKVAEKARTKQLKPFNIQTVGQLSLRS